MNDKERVNTAIRVVDKVVRAVRPLKAEIKTIRLHCPHDTGSTSLLLSTSGQGSSFRLPGPPIIRRVEVISLAGFEPLKGAVTRTSDEWAIKLPRGEESVGLNIDFQVDDRTLLRRLVHRDHDKEPRVEGDDDHYWLSAQLRNIEALRTSYGSVSLDDLDFHVNVGISNDIKSKVPRTFVRQMELSVLMVRERDRNKKAKLMWEQLHLSRRGPKGSDKVLEEIQEIFVPSEFSKFLEVRDQFKYANVRRGADASNRSIIPTFPKAMTVISETDLSHDNPTAQGQLVYKRADFREKLAGFFPGLASKM